MKMKINSLTILISLALGLGLFAQESNLNGYQIMQKVLNKTTWQDMQGDVKLILTSPRGEQRIREIVMYSRKRNSDESDMLMRFMAPADVKGIGFLTIEHKASDDERYLYLPAMRRTKRIASSGKGGNFMSSDFTYYDIGKPKLNDWKYKRLEDIQIDGQDCYQIECLPANEKIEKDTKYGKIIRWIRKDILVTIKSEYFDRGQRKWKELTVPGVEKIKNVWFQTNMIMKDNQSGHQSQMVFKNIKADQGLDASLFTQRYLSRRTKR